MLHPIRKILLCMLLIILGCTVHSYAQKPAKHSLSKFQIGTELQWYPAGWISGIVSNFFISPKHIINVRAAFNIADRYNWSGLNDDERGTGYGGSIGYRYKLKAKKSSIFIGTRGDLFRTKINWRNKLNTPQETSGSTIIIVYQPSLETGYWFLSKNKKWSFVAAGGIGQEVNIKTIGKAVGQGGMWLLSCSVYYNL